MGWGSELLPGTLQLSSLSLETLVMEAAEAEVINILRTLQTDTV